MAIETIQNKKKLVDETKIEHLQLWIKYFDDLKLWKKIGDDVKRTRKGYFDTVV